MGQQKHMISAVVLVLTAAAILPLLAIAAALVVRHGRGRGGGKARVGLWEHLPAPLRAFNPSVLDPRNVFVRVSPYHQCGGRRDHWARADRSTETTHWYRDGRLVTTVPHATDARPFRLGDDVYAVYHRNMPGGGDRRSEHENHLHLARLTNRGVVTAPPREVPLSYAGGAGTGGYHWPHVDGPGRPWEKNWSPLVHEGTLYLVYRIHPTTVLACDVRTGVCTAAYEPPAGSDVAAARVRGLRGGSQLVRVDGGYLGIGHDGRYRHRFYLLASAPPFALLRVGPVVRFPGEGRIQFVAGMCRDGPGRMLVSYGRDDCDSMFTHVELDSLQW